jgi:endonuclease/exonuclease/phosphatase family metal-dependent hydrolase
LVAWNVRNYLLKPPLDDQGKPLSPAKTSESIAAIVQTLGDLRPDIIGLCEMGTRQDLDNLQHRLKNAGLDLPHSTWVDSPDRDRHLALLSRFPLVSTQHVLRAEFKLAGISRAVQRGILDCTVQVSDNLPLRILGVHLKSRRIVPEFDQAEFRRMESIVLREHLDAILTKNPAEPVLVFGDFNDAKNSPVIRGIAGPKGNARALNILPLADADGDKWTYHWDQNDEYSRVDYVMVGPSLQPYVDLGASRIHRAPAWQIASDHRPLVVVLNLPATMPTP